MNEVKITFPDRAFLRALICDLLTDSIIKNWENPFHKKKRLENIFRMFHLFLAQRWQQETDTSTAVWTIFLEYSPDPRQKNPGMNESKHIKKRAVTYPSISFFATEMFFNVIFIHH